MNSDSLIREKVSGGTLIFRNIFPLSQKNGSHPQRDVQTPREAGTKKQCCHGENLI
jgi:hypothetical protein